jgi:DNA polymerase-3 subunit gamma/tau
MNAIRFNRVHQAYLFTGSRGIGKTSIARIFAKILRCENNRTYDLNDGTGAQGLRSCDECSSCREIAAGTSVDVIEIDGASNNGVESVREIRENAKYLPSTGSRKIYIIDEVHMLTTAAFNALLKTLEEPPAHVIFIFATTEPHKIPGTILSRCQRFDFRRISLAQIQARLAEITQAEKIQAEASALALIARAADGSMRDALSILDQVIAFSGDQVSVQSVRESIGLVESQTLISILSAIFNRKPLDALATIERAYQQGHDLKVVTRGLIEFCHGAILAKVGAPPSQTLEFSPEEWNELSQAAEARPLEDLELIFQVLHHGLELIIRSTQPKIVLDVLLVKCASGESLAILGTEPTASAPVPAAAPQPQPTKAAAVTTAPIAAPVKAPAPDAPKAQAAPASASTPPSWEGFVESVRGRRPLLATLLEHGCCLSDLRSNDAVVLISFNPQEAYFKEQLQSRAYQEQLLQLFKDYFGRSMHLKIELRDNGESIAAKREREAKERESAARNSAQNHPMIREAKALFGGELGPVELTDDSSGGSSK